MRSNNQKENHVLTSMQKQAVLVCIVCALAALLTIGITLTMLKRGKNPTEQPQVKRQIFIDRETLNHIAKRCDADSGPVETAKNHAFHKRQIPPPESANPDWLRNMGRCRTGQFP